MLYIVALLQAAAAGADRGYGLIGAGLAAGLAVVGAGSGIGLIGGRATEGIARQPEATARIQTAMIIAAALVEGVALFVAVIAFLIQGKINF
jgi:F-type H+-transporting ATPase subunit c